MDALVNNPRSTEYLRTPEIIAREGADRYADCKIIADRAQKRLWPEHLKNLETFKKWYAHTVRKVSFLNELSEEEWKNTYDNELRRYSSEHVAIPEGIKTEAQLLEEIEKRNNAGVNFMKNQIAQVKDPAQFKAFSYKPNQPQAVPQQQQGPGMR